MDRHLSEFVEAIATRAAPASGSSAAYALAMAAALVEKVARRSPELPDGAVVARSAGECRVRALLLVEADERAVRRMLASSGHVPESVQVPRQIRDLAGELRALAERVEERGNPSLVADAVGAGALTRAAEAMIASILRSNEG